MIIKIDVEGGKIIISIENMKSKETKKVEDLFSSQSPLWLGVSDSGIMILNSSSISAIDSNYENDKYIMLNELGNFILNGKEFDVEEENNE